VHAASKDRKIMHRASLPKAAVMATDRARFLGRCARIIEDSATKLAVGVVRHDEQAETAAAGRDRRHTCCSADAFVGLQAAARVRVHLAPVPWNL
jgi:hypothetical protein